ncbi:MAG: hypothetical protein VKJ02_17815 [Snowella sp.]|nr:hypothetical protein [Snowella sp.]
MNKKSIELTWLYRSLIKLYQKPTSADQGYMLFLVIALSIALSGLLIAYSLLTKIHQVTMRSSANSNSGFYGVEAALNTRAEQLRSLYIDYRRPSGTWPTALSACMDNNAANNGTADYGCQSQRLAAPRDTSDTLTAFSYVVSNNPQVGGVDQPSIGTVPPGDTFQNLNMLEYRYSINAVAKKTNAPTDQVNAIAGMAIKARLIPMFQFAAFYLNDLEILPGADMNLSGPIHTNGNLYLGANTTLSINSQVTASRNLFNSRKNDNSTYPNGRVRIRTPIELTTPFSPLLQWGTGSTSPTTAAMNPNLIAARWGSQIKLGIDALSIPDASILDLGGDYAQKADLQIRYTPDSSATTVPFELTATSRTTSGTVSATRILTEGERRSLLQPVLVSQALATITDANYRPCSPATPVNPGSGITLTTEQTAALANALYLAMVSQTTPIPFNGGNPSFTVGTTLDAVVDTFTDLTTSQRDTLKANLTASNPAAIAALDNRCFVSAPFQDIGRTTNVPSFYNDREGREMRLLQINVESLTIWNHLGRSVEFTNGTVTNTNNGQGYSANQRIFTTATADSNAPVGSFQNLGLAAADNSKEGLVFHATINTTTYPSAAGNQSPYGFAIIRGRQLPGLGETTTILDPTGLTFVSDQAVYLQGDYNTLNWQPASILADSLNVLSNACLNIHNAINKDSNANCNVSNSNGKVTPTPTTINTAFLAGTDITNSTASPGYNGGLENYPRFSENWGGVLLAYRGSFVSTSTPLHVRGTWSNQRYGAPNRNWDYDTRFNLAQNLPPFSPRFVYLKQESFNRNFNQ